MATEKRKVHSNCFSLVIAECNVRSEKYTKCIENTKFKLEIKQITLKIKKDRHWFCLRFVSDLSADQ